MTRLSNARLALAAAGLFAAMPLSAQAPSAATLLYDWWPLAAGGAGALAVLGFGALLWRRRNRPVMQLAAPAPDVLTAPDLSRLDLMLEIIGATRSVMMFRIEYRIHIVNRTARAANDLLVGVELACARRGIANGATSGPAHERVRIERVGPHQSRRVTGTAQLPLSAISPLKQGQQPLFIPLAHVTVDGEGLNAITRTFVIGTASTAGRVHPIRLDTPPGAIPDLTAQAVTITPSTAAAA